jgi:hypothetical protein
MRLRICGFDASHLPLPRSEVAEACAWLRTFLACSLDSSSLAYHVSSAEWLEDDGLFLNVFGTLVIRAVSALVYHGAARPRTISPS